jgi:glycosyltransferase involved in cell wall biosynthesis
MAYQLSQNSQDFPIYFIWVGGGNKGMDFYEIEHDIRHAGLENRVHFVDEVSNPLDYYAAFDVFAMMSREDPYPLVNLEVAALGKPIVCFEDSGGSPEFVESDAGFIVPYLDINLMAEKITALAKDKELRNKLGCRAAQKVKERHDITVGAPMILKIIERFL